MDDTISRQAAIDALRTCYDTETITMDNGDEYINYGDAVGEIEQLPSAQPELIRCKDCKNFRRWIDTDITFCDFTEGRVCEDDFCSRAEGRTDEL